MDLKPGHEQQNQEDAMKAAAVVAMMMVTVTVQAQNVSAAYFGDPGRYEQIGTRKMERAYRVALKSENEGVVESALAHVAMMKLLLPAANHDAVKEQVVRVARSAAAPELRYKAHLTCMVLDRPEMFREMPRKGYATADELFGSVASTLAMYYAAR